MADTFAEEAALLTRIIQQLARSGTLEEREEQRDFLQDQLEQLDEQVAELADQHHDHFYTALHAFFKVVDQIDDSKRRVHAMRNGLTTCKALLQCKRDSIRQLWLENLEYKETLRLLEKIEEIKQVPDKVTAYMKSKHHVHAARLLLDTTRALESEAFEQINALHDLRRQLRGRLETMHESLIEELHGHLYLKAGVVSAMEAGEPDPEEASADAPDIEEDLDIDPTSDSLKYLELTITALGILRRLPDTVTAIKQRLKTELSHIVEKTVIHAQDSAAAAAAERLASGIIAVKGSSALNFEPQVLFRLITQIFDQLMAVMRGHIRILRALRRQPGGIEALGVYDGTSGVRTYSAREVWRAMQLEVALLLCQYLDIGDDHQSLMHVFSVGESWVAPNMTPQHPLASSSKTSPLLTPKKHSSKNKRAPMFSFANSQNAITETSANIERSLRDENAGGFAKMAETVGDTYTNAGMQQKLLCEKSVDNIAGVFKPTMFFVDETSALLSLGTQTPPPEGDGVTTNPLRHFVESFVRQTFLPKIREQIHTKLQTAEELCEKPGEFTLPTGRKIILKGTWTVYKELVSLCSLIIDLPHFTVDIVNVLLSMLIEYKGICQQRYNLLVRTRGAEPSRARKTQGVLSAEWQNRDVLKRTMKASPAWRTLCQPVQPAPELNEQDDIFLEATETDLMLAWLEENQLVKSDIMSDVSCLKSLAHLYDSLWWFSGELQNMATYFAERPAALGKILQDIKPVVEADEEMAVHEIQRRLASEMIKRLQSLANEFRQLAETCMMTLRLEIRCHCLFYVLPVIRKSNFCCDPDAVETDPQVVSLNKDLNAIEEVLSTILDAPHLSYLFDSVDEFLCAVLIRNMKYIKAVNEHGIRRMTRSIFALQQNLSNITKSETNDLDTAKHYYELLALLPDDVLRTIVADGPRFSEQEYQVVLKLINASQRVPDAGKLAEAIQELGMLFQETI